MKKGITPPDATNEAGGGSDSTPPAAPDATIADVGGLAAELIKEAPEPQPHAIQQASDERAAADADSIDAEGTKFDAALHTGTKTGNGVWRKKPGRKANGASAASPAKPRLNLPGAGQSGPTGAEAKIASARASGVGVANLFIMLSVGLGGEEWMPRSNPDEKAMLEQGFADYFQSKEWEDLPPGLALVACLGMYALPRFAMPRTKERAKGFKNWLVGKYINWRARRAKKAYERKHGRPMPESDIERADAASRREYAKETAAHDSQQGRIKT